MMTTKPASGVQVGMPRALTADIAYLSQMLVNVYFVGDPRAAGQPWALVDAGLPGTAGQIVRAAEARFGPGARPAAIVLTHGHFDHVGALSALAERWETPIYAHRLELPYLTGQSPYPPPDPSVGGGAVARLSWVFPRGPFDFGARVTPLPEDGRVPEMPGWRAIHTPGHSPGHVALFREADRVLLAGDAFVTTRQESLLAVLTQREEMHGPPAYFTPDWAAAGRSVWELAALRPALAATGHGPPMHGERLARDLPALARDFQHRAVPRHGRYVPAPAITNERGIVHVPPPAPDPLLTVLTGVSLGLLIGGLVNQTRRAS